MALTAGSIAFVGYDADGAQRFAILAVDTLPPGTTVYFTDRAWNGSSFTGGGEGTLTWTVPAGGIASGTLISFDNVNSGSLTTYAEKAGATVPAGSVSRNGGFDLEQSNEVVYAYIGTGPNTPTSFLGAIANDGFTAAHGQLTGTGLTAGSTAVNIGAVNDDADFGVYQPGVGGNTFSSRDAMLSAVNNPGNWLVLDTAADDSSGRVPFLTSSGSPINNVDFRITLPTPVFVPGDQHNDDPPFIDFPEYQDGETFTFTGPPGTTVTVTFDGVNDISLTATEVSPGTFTVSLTQAQLAFLGGDFSISAQAADAFGNVSDPSPPVDIGLVICFCTGTRIATPQGDVPVEDLAPGDSVCLADGRISTVRWVGRQTVVASLVHPVQGLPIRITAGAFGENLPKRDLLVSPGHAFAFGDVLVQAGALVNGSTIRHETPVPRVFTYWHVELDEHALLLAEGVPAESFLDSAEPTAFDNVADRLPNGPIPALDMPRARSHRQVPAWIRALVAERAAALAPAEAAA